MLLLLLLLLSAVPAAAATGVDAAAVADGMLTLSSQGLSL